MSGYSFLFWMNTSVIASDHRMPFKMFGSGNEISSLVIQKGWKSHGSNYTYSVRKKRVHGFIFLLHFSNNIARHQQQCNVVPKKGTSFRKSLKITILFGKPDENGSLVCTIYFRTEEVLQKFPGTKTTCHKEWLAFRCCGSCCCFVTQHIRTV